MQRALRRVDRTIFLAIVVLLTFVTSARASGLLLYETGAPDLGTASAGRTAMASDASTVAANPAGMSLLDRSQLLGAAGALLPFTNFDSAPETTTSGGSGANAGVFFPIGSFFYVHKLTERIRLGFASDSDFGLSADWGKKWAGRYYATSVSIVTFKTNPSISYLVNDWLSIGAGFSFSVGRLTEQAKINNVLPRAGDGGLALESWDEAFGGNVGILLTPIKKLRIGLTYQSPVDYKFGFRPHVTNLGPLLNHVRNRIGGVKVNTPMEVPQQVMMSLLYDVTPYWRVMGNVGWQNWTAFGQICLGQFASVENQPHPNTAARSTTAVRHRHSISDQQQCHRGRRVGVHGCGPRSLQCRPRTAGRHAARTLLDELSQLRRAQCHLEILAVNRLRAWVPARARCPACAIAATTTD